MQKFSKGEFDSQDKLNQNFGELYQNVKTYSELQAMVTNNLLVAGTQYLLSDYRTKYQQPSTLVIKEMSVERLVLTATSANTFSVVCSSLDFPQDVVYYHFGKDVCEDGTTPRNGFIVRRVDESSACLDSPCDWRKIVWARYKPNQTQYLIGTVLTTYAVWTSGAAVIGVIYKAGNSLYMARSTGIPTSTTDTNIFVKVYDDVTVGTLLADTAIGTNLVNTITIQKSADYSEHLTFGVGTTRIKVEMCQDGLFGGAYYLPNNVFIGACSCIHLGVNSCYNTIVSSSQITFGSGCSNNILLTGSSQITFGSYCVYNFLGVGCSDNMLANDCRSNIFNAMSNYNSFGSSSCNNITNVYTGGLSLANGCNNNIFDILSSYNQLGEFCQYNTFRYASSSNILAVNCSYNDFGDNSRTNTLGCGCNHNTIGSAFICNTFGSDCRDNVFGTGCASNFLGSSIIGNTFGNNKMNLFIKFMRSKNISAVTALESRASTMTIEVRIDGVTAYWYLNSSNVPTYTTIA